MMKIGVKKIKFNAMKARENILWTVAICLLYWGAAKLGLEYAIIGQTVSLLWPPSGIALAVLMLGGYRLLPGIALGAFMANAETGVSILTVAIIALGNTLEPLLGALLLRRQKNFSIALDKVTDVIALVILAALISTIVGASFGTLGLIASGEIATDDIGPTWLAWWLGDGLGVIVISPVLLTGVGIINKIPALFSSKKTLEALILIAALIAVGRTIFGNPMLVGQGYFPISLSMFPFAIWSALRFGSIGASSVALIASLLAINGTVNGTGPFAMDSAMDSLTLWCLFADLVSITGLIMAALNSGREKALSELKNSKENLEMLVQQRTAELTCTNLELRKALSDRWRLQVEMNQISEERQKMIGQELHDDLGQHLTGIAFLVSSLHETLSAKAEPEAILVHQVKDLIGETLSITRSLSRGLYPIALETGGFSAGLHHLAEYTQSASGIQCAVRCERGAEVTDKIVALNLYRIAQEALCNALRHSKAQSIEIKLSESGEQYNFSIKDNGVGFPIQNIKTDNTLGLRSMRCRADLIGAAIEVRENPGGGTSIFVSGPFQRDE